MRFLSKRPVLFGLATTLAIVPGTRVTQRHHPRVPRVVIGSP